MGFLCPWRAVSLHPETTVVVCLQWLEGKEKDSH